MTFRAIGAWRVLTNNLEYLTWSLLELETEQKMGINVDVYDYY